MFSMPAELDKSYEKKEEKEDSLLAMSQDILKQPEPHHYNVVISGLGPGGMAAAFEAIKAGKKVLIVNKHNEEFLREQRVLLDKETRDYLFGLLEETPTDPEDIKIVAEIAHATMVPLNDIEKFLYKRLNELKPADQLSVRLLSTISYIEMSNNTLQIQSTDPKNTTPETVRVDNIVGADGAHHSAADILKLNENNPSFNYNNECSPEYPFHSSIYFTLKKNDGKKLNLPAEQFNLIYKKLSNHSYLYGLSLDMQSYENSDNKQVKCFLNGEVPQDLFENIKIYFQETEEKTLFDQKQKILSHIRLVLEPFFKSKGIAFDDIDIKLNLKHNKKDYFKLTAFSVHIEQADHAFVEHKDSGCCFFLVGDAFQSANYRTGRGINDAIKHARVLGQVMRGEITNQQYDKQCKKISGITSYVSWGVEKLTSITPWLSKLGVQYEMKVWKTEYSDVMPFEKVKKNSPGNPPRNPTLKLFHEAKEKAKENRIEAVELYLHISNTHQRARTLFHLSIHGHVIKELKDLLAQELSAQEHKAVSKALAKIHQKEAEHQNKAGNPAARDKHLSISRAYDSAVLRSGWRAPKSVSHVEYEETCHSKPSIF